MSTGGCRCRMEGKRGTLISTEHFIKSIQLLLSKSSLGEISPQTELAVGEIATLIEKEPTAFDKEKVIGELKSEIELCVTHPLYPGRYIKKSRAIEIVEKGGVK